VLSIESIIRTRNREENKSLNNSLVANEFEIKSKSVRQILAEMNNLYCISKEDKETVKMYADYIRLRKQNKINVGNANVLINCNCNRNYEGIVKILTKLLYKNGDIALPRYEIITDIHVSKNNNINSKELYILDDEYLKGCKLDRLLHYNSSSIFVIICNNSNIKELKNARSDFHFYIRLSQPTEDDKIKYIKNVIKENGFATKLNNKELSALATLDMESLDTFLMNGILKAYKKNQNYLSREELNIKPKPPKQGLNKLNTMVGLEGVKEQVKQIINYIKLNDNRGARPSLNMVFRGNPRNW